MEIVLNTFGTALLRNNDRFLISNAEGKQAIPPDGIKSITISKGASISSDAALLAIENGIDVIFVDEKGIPTGRLWSIKYGSITNIRRKQLDFTLSKKAVPWIKEILRKKIDNQVALLLAISDEETSIRINLNASVNRLTDYRKKLERIEGDCIPDIAPTLRGWEGAASRIYFSVWQNIIPSEYVFLERSQHPATDIINCLLNYGYGVLYGKIEGSLIKAGIDPYIGVLHREDYNRPVLIFDVIEIFRVWVDYVVLHLATQKVITEEFYTSRSDGSVWLESFGRRILIQSLNDYLSEIIQFNGLERSRSTHIDLYCQQLAQYFLNLKDM